MLRIECLSLRFESSPVSIFYFSFSIFYFLFLFFI